MRYGDAVSGSKKHFFESFPNLCLASSGFLIEVEFLMLQSGVPPLSYPHVAGHYIYISVSGGGILRPAGHRRIGAPLLFVIRH